MADDREILREVWEGRIPICFNLASDEVTSEQPDPFFVSSRFVSFLVAILNNQAWIFIFKRVRPFSFCKRCFH